MTRLDEMIGGETGFGGGWRRRNNENGTTRADKFINFFPFLLHNVFSFYNSCFSSLLMFSSLLLCEIVSGLRGGGGMLQIIMHRSPIPTSHPKH